MDGVFNQFLYITTIVMLIAVCFFMLVPDFLTENNAIASVNGIKGVAKPHADCHYVMYDHVNSKRSSFDL